MTEPLPIPRTDPRSRRMSAILTESAYNTGVPRQEYAYTAIELLNRLATVALQLEMRLPEEDNFVLGAEQLVKIEELRGAVENGDIPQVALNIHVMKQTKRIVERLENSVQVLSQCEMKTYCHCQLALDKEVDQEPTYDMVDLIGGVSIREHLNFHIDRLEGNEQMGMANAFDELGQGFKSCLHPAPRTRIDFLESWAKMWSTREFKNILLNDLRGMKLAAALLAKRKCPEKKSRVLGIFKRSKTSGPRELKSNFGPSW